MTKERLRRTADLTLDFESLKDGQTLYLDGELVKFAGENNGNVWVKWKRKDYFIPQDQFGDHEAAA